MQRVVGLSISDPCFIMVMCVINAMPVLFLHFITLQYTAALPARKSAADITLSDATSQNINKFITSRLLSGTY